MRVVAGNHSERESFESCCLLPLDEGANGSGQRVVRQQTTVTSIKCLRGGAGVSSACASVASALCTPENFTTTSVVGSPSSTSSVSLLGSRLSCISPLSSSSSACSTGDSGSGLHSSSLEVEGTGLDEFSRLRVVICTAGTTKASVSSCR
ncbi:hypothetical protein PF005_g15435 [Phytophthora fragariae]|uniref:Uncharacterized protein n=1 Tax=Phytophthora fragariae TaxID=53985 RepID=A0A6A3ELH2_9STRA|nr:hypothetical protein PF009_g16728 [Phytophthora fragariae]KAE8996069.1 hypothetical protein PF011_g16058 [Phytophthora fragariae]KAE9135509.1 hypothetical protein PF006_g14591 [Phytophthora fragariae]KAE9200223.1 hypothetical protein PF005_g15435 [Phytophthora fragariae]KAE9222358.1 hypothetical protein PF002_g15299 [Phytophthora fragariae]